MTGAADALRYPENLDEMIRDSDVVIEGRIVGEAGPPIEYSQPVTVAVEDTYRGNVDKTLIVQRLQTRYSVNGTPGTMVGALDGEPWYCPGELYMLFLTRRSDGDYQALLRVGAIPLRPRLDDQTLSSGKVPEPLRTLASLDIEALRARVRESAGRVGP